MTYPVYWCACRRRRFRALVDMTGDTKFCRRQDQHPGVPGAMWLVTCLAKDHVAVFRGLASGIQNHLRNRGVRISQGMLKVVLLSMFGMTSETERRVNIGLSQENHGLQVGTVGYCVCRMTGCTRHSAFIVQGKFISWDFYCGRRYRVGGMVAC